MHVRDLEHWLKARPFEPFVMNLTSGERIHVDHPDAAVPGTNAVLVINKRRGRLAGFSHISLFHVLKIEAASRRRKERSNGAE
ncbi:MAG: hypothetical protein HY287_00150 [Planctomycetes bacterium]|nr:hypothetical protein [Planctomycetota bacterium]MBI3832723.1 hypothetical protein [Planctomycetota bacterium]